MGIRRLLPYVRPYWSWLVAGAALALVVSAMDGLIAWLVKPTTDGIFIRRDLTTLKVLPLVILLVYLAKGAGRYGQSYLMATVGERVIAAIRRDLYVHIQAMPLAFFSGRHSADLMSRIVVDATRLSRLSSEALVMAFRQVGTVVALVAVMFTQEWRLTLLALIGFPLVGLTIRAMGRRLYQINRGTQEQIAALTTLLQEALTGTKIVKAFGREDHERARFDRINWRLLALSLKDHRVDELAEPLMEVLAAFGVMAILWYGGYRVVQGEMTPGALFSFVAATLMLYGPVRKLSRIANLYQQTMPSADRIFEVLALEPAVADAPGASVLTAFRDRIEFDHVWFQYADGEMVLKDICLTVPRGEAVAFVGMSGAGKSTLTDLIPRFHDVTRGRILIDGVDVREYTQASLRAQIAIVTQETFLFDDTIQANMAYGKPDATPEEIERAARAAYAHEFIVGLPDRYRTVVGERGVKLSGGQRQRVALARAFLKDPAILILDEATSDLDAESEFMVQQALADLTKGRTVFLIAHRLSTVRLAHRIVAFHEGRIVEEGRHDELLARDGLYRRLYSLQFAPTELSP
ncbi:MAG: ABC transporter ATP-binding protein [Candidatus Rokubacteria bacterium]|nr:ABC transporter ATP-binding protein [Candidatus Rokubacteria bacterium]